MASAKEVLQNIGGTILLPAGILDHSVLYGGAWVLKKVPAVWNKIPATVKEQLGNASSPTRLTLDSLVTVAAAGAIDYFTGSHVRDAIVSGAGAVGGFYANNRLLAAGLTVGIPSAIATGIIARKGIIAASATPPAMSHRKGWLYTTAGLMVVGLGLAVSSAFVGPPVGSRTYVAPPPAAAPAPAATPTSTPIITPTQAPSPKPTTPAPKSTPTSKPTTPAPKSTVTPTSTPTQAPVYALGKQGAGVWSAYYNSNPAEFSNLTGIIKEGKPDLNTGGSTSIDTIIGNSKSMEIHGWSNKIFIYGRDGSKFSVLASAAKTGEATSAALNLKYSAKIISGEDYSAIINSPELSAKFANAFGTVSTVNPTTGMVSGSYSGQGLVDLLKTTQPAKDDKAYFWAGTNRVLVQGAKPVTLQVEAAKQSAALTAVGYK